MANRLTAKTVALPCGERERAVPVASQCIPGTATSGNPLSKMTRPARLFEILRRRIVARVDRLRQELLLVVGPELADIRVGLDHRVDELATFALALADEDVADRIAVA